MPTGGLTAQVSWLSLMVGGHLALCLQSSNEPNELLPCHDDSSINIVVGISISIIIITYVVRVCVKEFAITAVAGGVWYARQCGHLEGAAGDATSV